MADVKLVLTADGTALRAELDADIRALTAFGRAVDVTNAHAVQAFKESAAAQRELMQRVGATPEQFSKLNAAVVHVEKGFRLANPVVIQHEQALDRIRTKARTGANALGGLAFAATGMGSSLQGATIAAGTMADSIASLSGNAKLAASAAGIGALIVSLGVLVTLALEARKALDPRNGPEGKLADVAREHIAALTDVGQVERELAATRQTIAEQEARTGRFGDKERVQVIANLQAKESALLKRRIELIADGRKSASEAAKEAQQQAEQAQKAQREIVGGLHEEVAAAQDRIRGMDVYARQREQIDRTLTSELAKLREATHITREQRAATADLLQLRAAAANAEVAQAQALANAQATNALDAGGDDPVAAHNAKLALIEAEKQARIAAGIAVATAEREAQQARQQLQREQIAATMSALQTIEQATIGSKHRELRAIGLIASSPRVRG